MFSGGLASPCLRTLRETIGVLLAACMALVSLVQWNALFLLQRETMIFVTGEKLNTFPPVGACHCGRKVQISSDCMVPCKKLHTLLSPGQSSQHIEHGSQQIQSDRVLKRYPKRYPNDTTNSNFRSSMTKYSFPGLGGGVCGEGWGWWGKAYKGKLTLPGGWVYRHDALAYVYIR